ncbi:glycoside hydrolase family 3 C-terminal domain-containing protein [Streptomyces sp. PRKS01-29]|nr:glycoside hydrolase family 3 C-terminal domain-containing protein [Streptomyces sabulosicollis]MBI0296013.1 glycoside hydrolase family 3 C-terminal domain-containing protein [Streptomyces sabulosicollis]
MNTYDATVEDALGKLDLDTKARLLAGKNMWTLPAIPEIGLRPLVMSDGPIGVRGVRWTADDPSIALPSPTALAATWDPDLARRAGRLLAQEARRKGVHVLLAPTVNLHRSPLGGRHFECYSEDPYLTGAIGTGYVTGVQDGGVGATVKHFVANDAETERFTVDNQVSPRALRELYLAPFEAIVANARPWGIMAAYNSVNGTTMTEHGLLQNDVLRAEWGFDGIIVSDWMAARSTVGDITGGLDVAMPGPNTVYGPALAAAVRAGDVAEETVDTAVRNVLRLAARVGVLDGVPPAVPSDRLPERIGGEELAREIARRSVVLLRNEDHVLPLDTTQLGSVALIGAAARDARVLGGGSAQVFPRRIVPPLGGLRAALGEEAVTYYAGADPNDELAPADKGFSLRAVCRDREGRPIGAADLPNGMVKWLDDDLPEGVTRDQLHTVEITGDFTPRVGGLHSFGTKGLGGFHLAVDGRVLFDGTENPADDDDPFEAFFGAPVERGRVELTAGKPVRVSLTCDITLAPEHPIQSIGFSLVHREPQRDAEELIAEAASAARAAQTAIIVVATTESVEREGVDRADLRLPGHQDELVARVAAANPRTIVIVNAGSPVEMPWRNDVAAILLTWFPGQEAGTALTDVLLGAEEPGGRLPTTWPARLEDSPVTRVTPTDGALVYEEDVFIGYRAWQKAGIEPAYYFGHGLGYTSWTYEAATYTPPTAEDELGTVTVHVRNTGDRTGRTVIQIYLHTPDRDAFTRPRRRLAGFATVAAEPGDTAEAAIALPRRAAEIWDERTGHWRLIPGTYTAEAGPSVGDLPLTTEVKVMG